MWQRVLTLVVFTGCISLATAEGGIFARGGGCANGMCSMAVSSAPNYYAAAPATKSTYATPKSTYATQQPEQSAPVVRATETRTPMYTYPVSTPRYRFFVRRWIR
jgi:hypothetical protein